MNAFTALDLTKRFVVGVLFLVVFFSAAPCLSDNNTAAVLEYDMEYAVTIKPQDGSAQVTLSISNAMPVSNGAFVKSIRFKNDKRMYSEFTANGVLSVNAKEVVWRPPAGDAWMRFTVSLINEKGSAFDSYVNDDWAIFRGDDLFPAAAVTTHSGAHSRTTLRFVLPKRWPHINTAWPREETPRRGDDVTYRIDNPERRFDRPTGWMIAGKIATRRDLLGNTRVSVSGPRRQSFKKDGFGLKRLEILTFLHYAWPEIQKILPESPPSLLIVGAQDPMWRGGLSAPGSLFIHADRPLVSENGSSTLLHEVFHSLTRIRGDKKDDWIAEGLAEYYSLTWLQRSGGMSNERLAAAFEKMEKRSKKVRKLRGRESRGDRTAKAVLVFKALDDELKSISTGRHSLDDVVRELIEIRIVSLDELRQVVRKLNKVESTVLRNIR